MAANKTRNNLEHKHCVSVSVTMSSKLGRVRLCNSIIYFQPGNASNVNVTVTTLFR